VNASPAADVLAADIIDSLRRPTGPAAAGRGSPGARIDWALTRREFLWPDVRLDFEDHPYLRGLYEDEHQVIAVRKASQMGMSEWAITDAFWASDARGANALYLLPGTGDVQDFSSTRIGLAIEASPYIAGIVRPLVETGDHRARQADRLTLKRIRDRFLYLRHASVRKDGRAPQLKVAAVDLVTFDELDEMDQRAVALGEKRLGHSALKWQRFISTPSLPDFGIDRVITESDQREWRIKCGGCGRWQSLDPFRNLISETDDAGRPLKWFRRRGTSQPVVACNRCGRALDVRRGKTSWVARHPGREIHGYVVNKLASPNADLAGLIRAGQTLDETKIKEWWNQDLGLPYQPRGGGFSESVMRASMGDYGMAESGVRTAMGIDVGAVLHVVIRRWEVVEIEDEDGKHRQVTRPALWIGETGWDRLDDLMQRYGVRQAVIDALPEAKSSLDFAKRWRHKVKVAFYVGGKEGTKHDEPTREKAGEEYAIELDRTRHFDQLRAAYEGGEITNPGSTASAVPDFIRHFGVLTRVIEKTAGGNTVARWIDSGPDHFAHADLYANAALDIIGPPASGETSVLVKAARKRGAQSDRATWQRGPVEPGGRRARKSTWQ